MIGLAPQSLDGSAFLMALIVIGLILASAIAAMVYIWKKVKEEV